MSDIATEIPQQSPRVQIQFRHSEVIKNRLDAMAARQNVDQSTLYRNVFNAGLKQLFGFEIVNNELVDGENDQPAAASSR